MHHDARVIGVWKKMWYDTYTIRRAEAISDLSLIHIYCGRAGVQPAALRRTALHAEQSFLTEGHPNVQNRIREPAPHLPQKWKGKEEYLLHFCGLD